MKRSRKILIGVLAVLVAIVLILNFYLGTIVKTSVETMGPAIVGVPIKLEHARFALLRGTVRLKGFVLGNPEGFKTEKAIGVGEIFVDLDMSSLLSDTLVIEKVLVSAPDITYELGLGKSNIGVIMDKMSGGAKKTEEKPAETKPATKEGQKVQINELIVEKGVIRLSTTIAGGAAAPVPLPTIRMTDIGKESGGASPTEVVREVFGAIGGAIAKAATEGFKFIGKGVDAAGDAAASGAKAVGEGADKLIKGLGGLLSGGEKAAEDK